ncbi:MULTISPECIES: DMT family transporter [Oribacterium]|jgi:DMT superfamily drug/metabolite transporter|uniref:DMT family transporter n=1 Tax=Oribacterium TaxID=265975 RepID=UPI00020DDC85|nr:MULTISPECIES: DMT family transporter [Oribacterium]EGL36206.1 putative membrane protein [Oribacterium sp. oral taxon 108 str. F0425]
MSEQIVNDKRLKGIISIMISAAGFAGMSFFVKLSGKVPVIEKAMFRNAVALVVAYIIMRREGVSFYVEKKNRLPLFLRCFFGTAGLICNFWAIGYLKLGDSSILQKMAPFFSIVMSIFILQEKPNLTSIVSVLVALIGAAFVVKPGQGLLGLPALVGLLGGFCAGTAFTFVRKLGTHGVRGAQIVFYFSFISSIALLPICLLQFRPLSAEQLLFLTGAGLCAAVGQIFVTKAYSYAPAKEISVFDYSQVIFSAILGFVILGELPDIYSFIGYALIFSMAIWKWKKD